MAKKLYLVFSRPPEGVTPEEYDRWYHHHVRENLVVPAFTGAQRYAVDLTMAGRRLAPGEFESDRGEDGAGGIPRFTHMAMYEYDGEIDDVRQALFKRIEAGEAPLPDWFDRTEFMCWDCSAVEDHVEPDRAYRETWTASGIGR